MNILQTHFLVLPSTLKVKVKSSLVELVTVKIHSFVSK